MLTPNFIMKKYFQSLSGIILALTICISGYAQSKYRGNDFKKGDLPEWENQGIFEVDREAPRAWYVPFEKPDKIRESTLWESSLIKSLKGSWKFYLSQNPGERPVDFFKDDFNLRDWYLIPVPSNWEMQGYDYPIYTNYIRPQENGNMEDVRWVAQTHPEYRLKEKFYVYKFKLVPMTNFQIPQ